MQLELTSEKTKGGARREYATRFGQNRSARLGPLGSMLASHALLCIGLLCSLAIMANPGQAGQEGEWSTLFAGEGWYQSEPGAEREFTGVLWQKSDGGTVSTLQRGAYYRLGERDIYTGAKRLVPLDELVGVEVIIRGKAVDMVLEGAVIKEIWPAAIRPAR